MSRSCRFFPSLLDRRFRRWLELPTRSHSTESRIPPSARRRDETEIPAAPAHASDLRLKPAQGAREADAKPALTGKLWFILDGRVGAGAELGHFN
jgi:hypothetical protein